MEMEAGTSLMTINEDLVLSVLDFTDVRTVLSLVARTCQHLRAISREWMPWRCLEVRFWVTVPHYQSKLGKIYTDALRISPASCTDDEVHARQLGVSVFFGQAGIYKTAETLLNEALAREQDDGRQADLLHALADVLWKAQQARQGGELHFVSKIVTAARRSIQLRRRIVQHSCNGVEHRQKLALTLEIFAENSACYAHYLEALGNDLDAVASRIVLEHGCQRVNGHLSVGQHIVDTIQEAEGAARECIALWAELDHGKLADAWAAAAAVDFYAGGHARPGYGTYKTAMAKLRIARKICTKSHGRFHPTQALILFNMGYISHLVFKDPEGASELLSESLAIREKILGLDHPFTQATREALRNSRSDGSKWRAEQGQDAD
jgi:tetratricopeptide (TPR) repeat protein